MRYEAELIKKEEQKTSVWSGGTTTQLAIYPKDAIYSERSFKWRLSSAKVEAEESVFTSLPDINRIIMILEGEIILEHEGHHSKVLKKFDQDSFSGSWTTKSIGKATDFNLMMREGCEGELEAMHLGKGKSGYVAFNSKKGFTEHVQSIYCMKGTIAIEISPEEVIDMYEGDIILIKAEADHMMNYEIKNLKDIQAEFIIANIFYNA